MDKKSLVCFILFIIIISVLAIMVSEHKKKTMPAELIPSVEANYNQTETNPVLLPKQNMNEKPNALDYMAPGARKASERLEQVQNLRKKSIEAQQEIMDGIE